MSAEKRGRRQRAGLPPTIWNGGTGFVTTLLAATTLPVPAEMPGMSDTSVPIEMSFERPA